MLSTWFSFSQTAVVTVNPEADAFVRASVPSGNYGGAGAIAVSGAAAVNGANQQNGAFDSLIRFPMSNVVATLDGTLGTHDWVVLRATLELTEVGAPNSPIFNRGVGTFEIRWITSDSWVEGTGTPISPTSNGVVWNDLSSLLNPAVDVSLGQFSNSGMDTQLAFALGLSGAFVSDVRTGGPVTLYLTAVRPQIGFTANSRSVQITANVPVLEIIAAANPHPRIESSADPGTNVLLSFDTISNWTYVVQFADRPSGNWSNLVTIPAQATNGHRVFSEPKNLAQRFYRLSVSQ